MRVKEEIKKVCFNCGSTDQIKKFKGKFLCEKCLFWYDTEDSAKTNQSLPKQSHHLHRLGIGFQLNLQI